MTRFGERMGAKLAPSDIVLIEGPLGSGKSVLARAMIRAVFERQNEEPPAPMPSPSFSLIQPYGCGAFELFHIDLYRLFEPEQLFELAIPEIFEGNISLIEWPDHLGNLRPKRAIDIAIRDLGGERREVDMAFCGERVFELDG